MSAKHTPGPWVAIRHDGYFDAEWRIKPAPPIKGSTVGFAPHAVVKGDLRIVNDTEKEANARLIAAAPDLLEAADNALGILIGSAVPAGGVDDRAAILDAQRQLRAAIAKARGEA